MKYKYNKHGKSKQQAKRINWTDKLISKLLSNAKEQETKGQIDWELVAKELDIGVNECAYKHAQLTDQPWSQQEEEILRDWWEYHDKDEKLDFTDLTCQITGHALNYIKAKLQYMTKHGIYNRRYKFQLEP